MKNTAGLCRFTTFLVIQVFIVLFTLNKLEAQKATINAVEKTINNRSTINYTSNKAPLQKEFFIKLPVTSFKPGGWLRKQLELQRDGLTGNLDEISIWLSKNDNAWNDAN